MSDDPYGGRKPGCLSDPFFAFTAVVALLVVIYGVFT